MPHSRLSSKFHVLADCEFELQYGVQAVDRSALWIALLTVSQNRLRDKYAYMAGAHYIGFLVDFSIYEFQLFVSLDYSKRSVFINFLT